MVSRRPLRGFGFVAVWLGVLWLAGCVVPEEDSAPVEEPTPAPVDEVRPVEREVDLEEGEWVRLEVVQQGVDLRLVWRTPDGSPALEIDGVTADAGAEPVEWVAEVGGMHRLEVHGVSGAEGLYSFGEVERRLATPEDRQRVEAVVQMMGGDELRDSGDFEGAARLYENALATFETLGERRWVLETLSRHGYLEEVLLHNPERANRLYLRALELSEEGEDPILRAGVFHHLGYNAEELGDMERALEWYQQAYALRIVSTDRAGLARTSNDLGYLHARLGEWHRALEFYDRSLELFRELGPAAFEARVLHNRGHCLAYLGRFRDAAEELRAALVLRRRIDDPHPLASTLASLGFLELEIGQVKAALERFQQAEDLATLDWGRRFQREKERTRGTIELGLGDALSALGRSVEGRERYERALEIFRQLGDLESEASVLRQLGRQALVQGELDSAQELFDQTYAQARQQGNPRRQAVALLGLARVARQRGDLGAAQQALERALERMESLRLALARLDFRTDFFVGAQVFFDEYIDLLMERHRARPDAGFDALAFDVSERARARSLLDALGGEVVLAPCPEARELAHRAEAIARRIRARELGAARRSAGSSVERESGADSEGEALWQEWRGLRQQAQARCGGAEPRGTELVQQVVEPGDLLLEYRLGAKGSLVWVAQAGQPLEVYELAPSAEIDPLVRLAWEQLQGSRQRRFQGQVGATLEQLSQHLLAPVAERLGDGHRLLVVGERSLHYLPFGALPSPDGSGRPLVATHEVVQLPSATAFQALKARRHRRAPAQRTMAVVADPVFTAVDERVQSSPGGRGAAQSRGLESWARLPHSAREAASIASLVDPEQVLLVLGFEARRERVLGGELADYRILHFATHGRLDTEEPLRTSLLLSGVDARGEPLSSDRVSLRDIYALELGADLVALSACETALGQEIRGEGLVGLTQGFFQAGASRVLVSLWKIDDEATSVLMEELYRGYLGSGLDATAALRRAQNQVRSRPGWEAPYYWAAFVLQGDV